MLTERARAKVNLTLAVTGRRADGYHLLDSLVVFADVADDLTLEPGPDAVLAIDPAGDPVPGDPADNLVARARLALGRRVPSLIAGRFTLTKRLPIAAGIGGGSADAAAALRLLARANALPPDAPALVAAARETGADVPVCLADRAARMRGVGEIVEPLPSLPPLPAVLVNPRVALETRAVFAKLAWPTGRVAAEGVAIDRPLGWRDLVDRLAAGRNDLEPPAIALCPPVADARDALVAAGAALARMSGSGATVFGLFETDAAAAAAAKRLTSARPAWWVSVTRFG